MDIEYNSLLLKKLQRKSAESKKSRVARIIRQPLRTLVPKVLIGVNKTHKLKTSTFWGSEMAVILPEVVSTQIWRDSYFEEDVCTFMIQHAQPGMTFIDIGAHYGFFTLLASHLVGDTGQVLSFEPTPSTFTMLATNTNHLNNIEIFNFSVLDRNDEIDFFDFGTRYSAFNSFVFGIRGKDTDEFTSHAGQAQRIKVKSVTIDSFLEQQGTNVDCVKIDAESTEMAVLFGMSETIERYRPILIIELGDFTTHKDSDSHSHDIVDWLLARDYVAYEMKNKERVPHIKTNSYRYCNLLFLPK